ncbi:MAG: prolyl oligopeptidase family serine peptidase [Clostridia bacterium]|nr:prolyl oligopeptidase family serine peptidase [Clostridia bacterium]
MKKLNKQKCHQVAVHLDITCEYNTAEHSRALDGILTYLENTYNNVDFNRIYLAGISHGGYACVYEVLRKPDKYAAAVISMAYTFNEELMSVEEKYKNPFVRTLTREDYNTLSKTPFYISWAKDDCLCMTTSNELLSENLKDKNEHYKEKTYETGGHKIASDFFKNSDWDEWMFGLKNIKVNKPN